MTDAVKVCVWPDYTTCHEENLEEYLGFMSDDFAIIEVEVNEYADVVETAIEQFKERENTNNGTIS